MIKIQKFMRGKEIGRTRVIVIDCSILTPGYSGGREKNRDTDGSERIGC